MQKGRNGNKLVIAVVQSTQKEAERLATEVVQFMMCRNLECYEVHTLAGKESFFDLAGKDHFDLVVVHWPASKKAGDNFLRKLQGDFPETLCVVLNSRDFSFVPENLSNLAGFGNLSMPGEFFRVMDRAVNRLSEQQQEEREAAYG